MTPRRSPDSWPLSPASLPHVPEMTSLETHIGVRNSRGLWEGSAFGYLLPVAKAVQLLQILHGLLQPEEALLGAGKGGGKQPEQSWGEGPGRAEGGRTAEGT